MLLAKIKAGDMFEAESTEAKSVASFRATIPVGGKKERRKKGKKKEKQERNTLICGHVIIKEKKIIRRNTRRLHLSDPFICKGRLRLAEAGTDPRGVASRAN